MTVSGKTKIYGLIGRPVSHSLSPIIMNHAFERHNVDAVYVAWEVERADLSDAVKGLQALGVAGVNVTYPYKEAILAFTNDPSRRVRALHAANTLIFKDKRTFAFNTDTVGVKTALESWGGLSLAGKKVLIFGAGGAGRAAAYGMLESSASEVKFCIRDISKGADLIEHFHTIFPDNHISFIILGDGARLQDIKSTIETSDIVINATPVGMNGYKERLLPMEAAWFRPELTCFDFVYHPRDTQFLKLAKEGGAKTLGGLELLVAQAQEAFRLWTGKTFLLQEMLDHASAFQARTNLPVNTAMRGKG